MLQAATTDPKVVPLRFLFKGYKREYFLWEVVESARRILYVSILPLLTDSSQAAAIGLLISVIDVLITHDLEPYQKSSTNTLCVVGRCQIAFTYFVALVLDGGTFQCEEASSDRMFCIPRELLGTVCTVANVVILAVGAWFLWSFEKVKG